MPQFHPPISGMPLGFVLLLSVLESLRSLPFVKRCLPVVRPVLGAAIVSTTLLSFISGYQASSALGIVPTSVESLVGSHHAVGRFALINAILVVTFMWVAAVASQRRKIFQVLYGLSLACQLILTAWAGTLGGKLVFEHGAGVRTIEHAQGFSAGQD